MLSWTQIKAPAPGRVVERMVDAGTAIFPGSPILVIESTDNPQVLADLPTEHMKALQIGKTVNIRIAESTEVYKGRIAEVVPLSNPATHSVQFKVNLPPDFALPIGQFVRIEVPLGTRDALLVPNHAVRHKGQLTGLFVIDNDSMARFRLAKVTPYDADRYEVLSGAEPDEIIVIHLDNRVIDGIPVDARQ
jgi:RND family efflux transporter MFP subunit